MGGGLERKAPSSKVIVVRDLKEVMAKVRWIVGEGHSRQNKHQVLRL